MRRALVAGATGYLGGHLLDELRRRGWRVRALVRRPEQRAALEGRADEVFLGQVTEPATLRGVADGVDCVFSTIGITRQKDGLTYEAVDYQGNLNLLQEAERAGVGAFLYVSVLHGRSLRRLRLPAAKERFVDALEASPVKHCVARPTAFFRDTAEILEFARKGRVVLFGDGQARINPIAGRDLAVVLADAVNSGHAEIEAGGPMVYTWNEIAALAFSALGKKERVWHVPRRLASPVAWISGAFEFFPAVATQDMVAPRYGSERLEDFYTDQPGR